MFLATIQILSSGSLTAAIKALLKWGMKIVRPVAQDPSLLRYTMQLRRPVPKPAPNNVHLLELQQLVNQLYQAHLIRQ